jgi:hypothetical protein
MIGHRERAEGRIGIRTGPHLRGRPCTPFPPELRRSPVGFPSTPATSLAPRPSRVPLLPAPLVSALTPALARILGVALPSAVISPSSALALFAPMSISRELRLRPTTPASGWTAGSSRCLLGSMWRIFRNSLISSAILRRDGLPSIAWLRSMMNVSAESFKQRLGRRISLCSTPALWILFKVARKDALRKSSVQIK